MENLIPIRPGFGGFDEPYERANVVFMGVPLDITSSYRSGYRFAPARIREASANLETYVAAAGLDVFERLNISDVGDLTIVPTDIEITGQRISRAVRHIHADGKMPVLLGGEHTLSYFAIRALKDVFVVHLDAHRDLRDEYMGDRICHATVMRRVLDYLPPARLLQIGVRSCSKEEDEFARKMRIKTYSSEQVIDDTPRIVAEARRLAGNSRVYLTIDLDILDPAFAPGVATPEPGGPSTIEILRLIRELGKLNIWAFDVVELVPPHDDGTTAFAAAKIIYELLAAIAGSPK